MSIGYYAVPAHYSTRQINAAIRRAVARAVADTYLVAPGGPVVHNHRRVRRPVWVAPGERMPGAYRIDHSHGMGNSLRDTLVAIYEREGRTLLLATPANYQGWAHSDQYTRARIKAADYIRTYLNLDRITEEEYRRTERPYVKAAS